MRNEKTQEAMENTWVVLKMLFLASLSVFLWAATLLIMVTTIKTPLPEGAIPKLGDEANLLFGASSVSLVIFSIVVGTLAVLGWQSIKKGVKREIEASTQKKISELEQELQGRAYAIIGFMIGQLSLVFDDDAESVPADARVRTVRRERKEAYLIEAIRHLQNGYKLLRDLKSLGKYMALNNLVDYSCALGRGLNPDQLMRQALELKEVGTEYDNATYLLTYCEGVATCGAESRDLEEAMRVVRRLEQTELTPIQKNAATRCVALLQEKLSGKRPEE